MQFYELEQSPGGDAETCYREEQGYNQGDAASCPACGGTISMLSWLPPFRVELELHGKEFGDFAFAPAANDILVTQKFCAVYHDHKLTGLTGFDPVEVLRIKGRRELPKPPTYFRVSVGYDNPALDLAASGFQWHEPPKCTFCREATKIRWQRLALEEGTWLGEDAFRPRGMSAAIMVSQRFKDACEKIGITNAFFTTAEVAGQDFEPWNKG
jgi:hypothetical protein